MLISIHRKQGDDKCTPGLLALDGIYECHTLEPRMDQSQGKPYAIPAGRYSYRVALSAHFGRDVIKVDNVPGFDAIELHPGNYPADTHGCCLVGLTEGNDFIGHSQEAFNELMSKVPPAGDIEYINWLA